MKKTIRTGLTGVGIAIVIFAVMGMFYDLQAGGNFELTGYSYTKMLLGAVITGLGFSLPSFIYRSDRVPYPLQVVFHMGIGCAVMLITAFAVGWIPTDVGASVIALVILSEIGLAFVIWLCFLGHYRKEAREMNRKLRGLNNSDSTGKNG